MQDHLGRTNFALHKTKTSINKEVEAHYKQQRLFMLVLRRKNESKDFQTVADLFKTTRQERNKYFGTYLAEVTDERPLELEGLVKKVDEQVEMYEELLKNLKGLREVVVAEKRNKDDLDFLKRFDSAIINPDTKDLVLKAILEAKKRGLIV